MWSEGLMINYLVMEYSDIQKMLEDLSLCCLMEHFHIQDHFVVEFLVEVQGDHLSISTLEGD